MGFELIFVAKQFTLTQWEQLLPCFEAAGSFHALETGQVKELPAVAYAFKMPVRESWPEDFLLSLDPQGLYLCFHSATGQQEKHITELLTKCLLQLGVVGSFEEF